jgi:hypothetical protein
MSTVYLPALGLQSPREQYAFYLSAGTAIKITVKNYRKVYFTNKWIREIDPDLKDIFASRGGLHVVTDRKNVQQYLARLKATPRRLAYVPIAIVALGLLRKQFQKLGTPNNS